MKLYITSILLFILLFAGCKKEPLSTRDKIAGTWEWTSTIGGIHSVHETPGTEDYKKSLVLDAGKYYSYQAEGQRNELIGTGSYTIKSRISKTLNTRVDFIIYNSGNEAMVNIVGDSMTLIDDFEDGYISTYVRAQ